MTLQSQRIPLGTVRLGERELPVFISVAWLKALQGLETAAAPAPAPAPTPAPAPAPAPDDGDDSERLDAIELDYHATAAVMAMAMSIRRNVQGLEVDATAPALLARIARLERRIDGLEQA
jgi:hypothetical protein